MTITSVVRHRAPERHGPRSPAILSWCAALAWVTATQAQINLGFEDAAPQSGAPVGWRVTTEDTLAEIDTTTAARGLQSLRLTRVATSGGGRVAQEIDTERFEANRVRVSAHVKIDDSATMAVLSIRVEGDRGLLYVDSLPVAANPTAGPWMRYEIEAPLDGTARRLSFGAEIRGDGSAWFDDFAIHAVPTSSLPPPSPAAARYVERALAIIEENSVNRELIDWRAFRSAVLEQARGADTVAASHLAVRFAMSHLADGHSYFMAPRQMTAIADAPVGNARTGRDPVAARSELLASSVGYLRLPGFAGGTHTDQVAFAVELQRHIARLDAADACGFVLDLRSNSGGNLWPMLVGIGPLLGDGEVAIAIDPSGTRTPVWYRDGKAGLGDSVQLRVREAPYRLRNALAPIAVLADRSTASAAEIIAGALGTRIDARRFGTPTRGAVTGTRIFPLADGAALVLAVTQTGDRNGRVYSGPLDPDEVVEARAGGVALADQPVVRAALEWLQSRPACQVR
ncbi:MAG TPA: S41 family peptidase [Gammaproteobacteria bacterium]|nr:S41 family peptidase [Gammaproteobacteria bacterium]